MCIRDRPPSDYSPELTALWHTKKGNWDNAHDIVSDINSKMGSWIHAHLHVIEGDLGNAAYWYNRSQRDPILQISWRKNGFFWLNQIFDKEIC